MNNSTCLPTPLHLISQPIINSYDFEAVQVDVLASKELSTFISDFL